ncbi:MAG: anthranilate phosphoribosyltransferase [Candidatus Bipolaricaulia bacterium]
MSESPIHEALNALADGAHLDADLAVEAMTAILEGRAEPSQIGAFLMGLRVKGETVDEIAAFAHAMRAQSVRLAPQLPAGPPWLTDVCGTGGAPVKTFNVSTMAMFVVAGAGVPVAKHGNRGVTSPSGSADLVEALGAPLDAPPEAVQSCIETDGIGFLFAPSFHPAMRHAAPVRRALGLRTVFNLLGPLTNPAGAQSHLMGVFDPELVDVYPEVLRELGVRRALVVHGEDGLDEVSTLGPTRVGELANGTIRHYAIEPGAFGLNRASPETIGGFPADEGAKLTRQLLTSSQKDARSEMLVINAGAAIFAGGGADSLEAGLSKAQESIQSGAALSVLDRFVATMNGAGDGHA